MIDYQEILDRIASLERTVRNLGIGQELVLGSLHVLGDINADGELIGAVVADPIETNTVNERTATSGVTVDGVLLKDSEVTTDVINEKTGASGVTVDGLLIKDGGIDHGATTGKDDDDHGAIYPGIAQTEAITGTWTHDDALLKKPMYDVRAFGAVADGSTRADDKIQDTIDAAFDAGGGIVHAPAAGVGAKFYKMDAPLDLKPGVSIHGAGAEMVTINGTVYRGTVFRAAGKFPIIRNWQAGAGAAPDYSSLKNLILEYDNLSGIWDGYSLPVPGSVSPSTTPVGIYIGTTNIPHGLIIENVRVLNAGYGLFMEGGSFLNTFNRLDVDGCRVGIYCEGSAAGFWGCESRGLGTTARDALVPDAPWDKQAWVLVGNNYVLDYCDAENYLSSTNPVVDITDCSQLTINGFSIEAMDFGGASCVRLQDLSNATVNGLIFADTSNTMQAGGTRYLFVNGCKVVLSGLRVGYDTFPGGATRYGLYIEGSKVAVRASSLHDNAQGNVFAVGITGTSLTFDASSYSSLYNPNNVVAGGAGGCHGSSYPISNQTITEGNTYTSGDLRDGTIVPSDAIGLWMMLYGYSTAIDRTLLIDSADDTPDAYSGALKSQIANQDLSGVMMVRLGTGANAGKVKIKALTGDWGSVYAWPVGYWK